MKDSVGELSLVVIVLLAIALIAGVVNFLNDTGENYILDTFNNLLGNSTKTSSGQESDSILYTNISSSGNESGYNNDKALENELQSPVNTKKQEQVSDKDAKKLKETTDKNINNNNKNCKGECVDTSNISDELDYSYYVLDDDEYIVNVTDDKNNTEYYYTYDSKDTFILGKQYELDSVISSDSNANQEQIDDFIESEEDDEFLIDEDYISKADSNNNSISKDDANNIYKNNVDSIVILNTYNNDIIKESATGFFITKGLIMTSWTYIKDSLTNGNNIVALSNNNKSYNVLGIVTINIDSDIAILKIDNEVGKKVSFNNVNKNDELLLLGTNSGFGLSGSVGKNLSNGDYQTNVLYISYQNIGSPLFNKNGEVIGMVMGNIINKDITRSVSSGIIQKYADYYDNIGFNNISSYTLNELSNKYYKYKIVNKKSNPSIMSSIWDKYKTIGNIEENIPLTLVKASSTEKGVSLRYLNDTNVVNNLVISNFVAALKDEDFKEKLNSNKKKIYSNKKYNIFIYYEFNYVTVVIKDVLS